VCELSSSTHLCGAQERGPGRQVITISRRGILELPADASALTALETRHRMPRVCTTGCPENQRSCARRFHQARGCAASAFAVTANRNLPRLLFNLSVLLRQTRNH
jgi:hypothetical protein